MEKVVLLCRVSTQGQDYQYQIETLKELAKNRGWEVVATFANKVSGAKKNEERSEIVDLIAYVKNHKVDKVIATEISRIGRNTLEALKTIEVLNENKVCLYLANYGLETLDKNGKVNPITSLLCTILLEISQMERGMIRERMRLGYQNYLERRKTENLPLGRPSTYRKSESEYRAKYSKELSLLRKGISLRNVCAITGTSVGTLRKIRIYL